MLVRPHDSRVVVLRVRLGEQNFTEHYKGEGSEEPEDEVVDPEDAERSSDL